MDVDTGDDAYAADGDFVDDGDEEELPAPSPSVARGGEDEVRPPQRSSALHAALLASDDDADLSGGDDDHAPHSAGDHDPNRTLTRRATRTDGLRSSTRVSGRHVLDNSLWTFAITATRVRGLLIPVATRLPPARKRSEAESPFLPGIRELRIFAALDKQVAQTRGSEWKREARPETPKATQRSHGTRKPSLSRVAAGLARRSGFLEEAKWRNGHGRLQWTMPMEKFRRLKAASPRIKVLVFGIGENAVDAAVSRLNEDSAQKLSGSVVSCGWFFLDLRCDASPNAWRTMRTRTPELPEKWLKLQNSRFGGEILISTSFAPFSDSASPVGTSVSPSSKRRSAIQAGAIPRSTPEATAKSAQASTPTATALSALVPPVVEDGEHLRLGSRGGSDVFVISVLLQAAVNVAQVVEATLGPLQTAPPELYERGFWLSYSLFDVVVRTDVFHNLEVSEFLPIRDSFRVRSCVEDLADFFTQQTLAVYLCTYGRVLAGVEIPLSSLLAGELFVPHKARIGRTTVGSQACVDGSFAFPSAGSSALLDASVVVECVGTAPLPPSGSDGASAVRQESSSSALLSSAGEAKHEDNDVEDPHGISTVDPDAQLVDDRRLKVRILVDHIRLHCGALARYAGEEGISLELSVGTSRAADVVRFRAFTKSRAMGGCDALVLELENSSLQDLRQSRVSACCVSAESQRDLGKSSSEPLLAHELDLKNIDRAATSTVELLICSPRSGEQIGECVLTIDVSESSGDDSDKDAPPPRALTPVIRSSSGDIHVYRVFLQLTALRDFQLAQELSIVYENPFTGKGKVELPGVQIPKRSEVRVDDAFCVFELLEDEPAFKQSMQSSVMISFLSRMPGTESAELELMGTAVFSLNFLYFSQEQFCCAALTCGATFSSEQECEAHWDAAHRDLAVDNQQQHSSRAH
ncbi:hypothetical protein PybrP1_008650, partial [[Pythium] brassicae (nom. inval.)]